MKIAVFHHGVLSSPLANLGDEAVVLFAEQMEALKQSGLSKAATEIHLGMNSSDMLLASAMAPDKATVHSTGDGSQGEKPTLKILEQWLPGHEGWFVCYHHMKGCCSGGKHESRRCMEEAVIWNWRQCIHDLQSGFDAVGCHWLDWRVNAVCKGQRYFGGTFWWTTHKFLSELPPLNDNVNNGRYYEGEIWIGRHAGEIRVRDYHRNGRMCCL